MEVSNKAIKITELLPQQSPFVMIDNLVDINSTRIVTNLHIKPDNIFIEGGVLTEAGIIENIAQTGAVRMGYINKYVNNDDIKLGFIGEIKNLSIEKYPRVNDVLITTVEITHEILSTLLVRAEAKVKDNVIAACIMKIAMTEIASLPAKVFMV